MARYIKLPRNFYDHLRREAALRDRTIQSQALHWLAIGKAIEASDLYSPSELSALLERFGSDQPSP